MVKRAKSQQVKDDYKITRDKFFDTEERNFIMHNTKALAQQDECRGKKIWPVRWMLVHLVMNTGLRVSEIAALKIGDIYLHLEQPYIKVHKGKRGKSRDVYIDKELVAHLNHFIYRKSNAWNRSLYNPRPMSNSEQFMEDVIMEELGETELPDPYTKPDAPLFLGSGRGLIYKQDDNRHYTTTGLNRAFKAAVLAAGLRAELSIHSARHTYATLLLHKTGNIRYVQKQLGHANLNMTALYADILPEENGKLANMILDDEPNNDKQ